MSSSRLYQVRTGRHDCYDRVVFDIAGTSLAGYNVRYVPSVSADPSDIPVPVSGNAVLQVVVRAPDLFWSNPSPPAGAKPWTVGQSLYKANWPALREVKFAGSFEGQVTFAVGVSAKLPFFVSTWQDGQVLHVILDIACPK